MLVYPAKERLHRECDLRYGRWSRATERSAWARRRASATACSRLVKPARGLHNTRTRAVLRCNCFPLPWSQSSALPPAQLDKRGVQACPNSSSPRIIPSLSPRMALADELDPDKLPAVGKGRPLGAKHDRGSRPGPERFG